MNAETGNDGTLVAEIHTPDLAEAQRFLDLLGGPDARWTFQTFDDDPARREKRAADAAAAGEAEHARMLALGHAEKVATRAATKAMTKAGKDPFARIFCGTLKQHARQLARLNADHVGVFVTVNETDLKGRQAENVVRVRAIFADLDGVDLEGAKAKLAEVGLVPHIVVQSSPGRWHLYMLVAEFPLARFTDAQQRVIKLLGSDRAVHDLPRVMRLPGFDHHKRQPFCALISENEDHQHYSPEAFDLLPPIDGQVTREHTSSTDDPLTEAVERLGLIVGDGAGGGYDVTCPWEAEHSTPSAASATTFWPPRGDKPGFKCQHAHCAGRSIRDFIAEVRRRDHRLDEHYNAMKKKTKGVDEAPPPRREEDYGSGVQRSTKEGQTNGSAWQVKQANRILTGDQFRAEYVPLVYVVDGFLESGRLLCLTARTGHGKTTFILFLLGHIANGKDFMESETIKGHVVLVLAENVVGTQHSYIAMVENWPDFDESHFHVFVIERAKGIEDLRHELHQYAVQRGIEFAFIAVDSASVLFPGDDFNNNSQQRDFAADLALLKTLPGNPGGFIICHPTKSANGLGNMWPIGGTLFVSELDGNVALWRDDDIITVGHTKLRIAPWDPFKVRITSLSARHTKDAKGRPLSASTIQTISEDEAKAEDRKDRNARDRILQAMHAASTPEFFKSSRPIGVAAGLCMPQISKGHATLRLVQRVLKALTREKLITYTNKHYLLRQSLLRHPLR